MADETISGAATPAIPLNSDEEPQAQAQSKRSATETLREEASKLGQQAADQARSFADEGKAKASSALDEFARLMAGAADDVDAKLGAEYGRYARSAAEGISGFADSLRSKEVEDLLADANALIRKSPAVAVGTAAALGFVLARLVKSGVDSARGTNATAGTDAPAAEPAGGASDTAGGTTSSPASNDATGAGGTAGPNPTF